MSAPPASSVTVTAGLPARGGTCWHDVHAKSRLTLEPLRTLRSETKGQAGACPDRTRTTACNMRAVTAEITMIRNMRGMVSVTGEASDRVQAGRADKFAGPNGRHVLEEKCWRVGTDEGQIIRKAP